VAKLLISIVHAVVNVTPSVHQDDGKISPLQGKLRASSLARYRPGSKLMARVSRLMVMVMVIDDASIHRNPCYVIAASYHLSLAFSILLGRRK
jgi:hypothetical protein